LLDRPKTGFDLPIYKWLKNDLSYLIDDLLSDNHFFNEIHLSRDEVSMLVSKFRMNDLLYVDIIWRIIFLRLWFRKWIG
jgi:asparagine synthase (glutamine-hydrolysing)